MPTWNKLLELYINIQVNIELTLNANTKARLIFFEGHAIKTSVGLKLN